MGRIIFSLICSGPVLATALLLTVLPLHKASYPCNIKQPIWLAESSNSRKFSIQGTGSVNRKLPANGPSRKEQPRVFSQQDVGSLVHDCFDGLFRVDTATLTPNFVVGDFDNDGAPDVFVAVRLARSVSIDDKSQPPFNYQDVIDSTSPASAALKLRTGDLARPKDGRFWVVLHHLEAGKTARCPSKQRKFVLLFVEDKGTSTIRLFHGKRLPPGTIGDPKEDEPPPRLKGDAILLVDDKSYGEALFWDGSRYRWYPFNSARLNK